MPYRRSPTLRSCADPAPPSAQALALLALLAPLVARAATEWDDLRPVSEPATTAAPPPGSPGAELTEGFFLELGFSFMVGLAAGYALKLAFKLVLVAIGVILLGTFGLQYAGLIQVDWSALELRYDGWADWLAVNGRAFLDFIGRNLSSAASFVAGLALGLKL